MLQIWEEMEFSMNVLFKNFGIFVLRLVEREVCVFRPQKMGGEEARSGEGLGEIEGSVF
jgi:hypothetical protein